MKSQTKSENNFTSNNKLHYIRKIEFLMSENNITWLKLSKVVGMSREGLFKSVKDNNLKVQTLIEIANFFGVPATYFFDDKEEYTMPDVDKVMNVLTEIIKERM